MNKSLSPSERLDLLRSIRLLPQADFEALLFALNPPHGVIPPYASAQGDRAIALLQWAAGPTGCGLQEFVNILALIYASRKQHEESLANSQNKAISNVNAALPDVSTVLPKLASILSLSLSIDTVENLLPDDVANELATLCKALNAYHVACGGNGLEIDDWETLVVVRELAGI